MSIIKKPIIIPMWALIFFSLLPLNLYFIYVIVTREELEGEGAVIFGLPLLVIGFFVVLLSVIKQKPHGMVKKAIITVFIIIVLFVVSSEAFTIYRGKPSRLWSDTYCGGDNGFGLHPVCGILGGGYKQQCRLFVCTFEPVPVGLPSESTEWQPDDDDDDDDEETAPSS